MILRRASCVKKATFSRTRLAKMKRGGDSLETELLAEKPLRFDSQSPLARRFGVGSFLSHLLRCHRIFPRTDLSNLIRHCPSRHDTVAPSTTCHLVKERLRVSLLQTPPKCDGTLQWLPPAAQAGRHRRHPGGFARGSVIPVARSGRPACPATCASLQWLPPRRTRGCHPVARAASAASKRFCRRLRYLKQEGQFRRHVGVSPTFVRIFRLFKLVFRPLSSRLPRFRR
jgi:hypothetical protein